MTLQASSRWSGLPAGLALPPWHLRQSSQDSLLCGVIYAQIMPTETVLSYASKHEEHPDL